jgi:FAD/FMN-containing dehydrogenase/Fe-S oxidoreductase
MNASALDLARVEEDLRGIVSGDVACDLPTRTVYATDGSLLEAMPSAVVRPRSTADVAATVRWAAEHGCPVHARGAGTSLCGGPLGGGVVIDFSRYMRRVVLAGEDRVRAQSGVVCEQLRQQVARGGRCFGPDPANPETTTLGGMIGRDSSGSRFPRHGATRRWIQSAEVVLADGSVHEIGSATTAGGSGRLGGLRDGVASIVGASRDAIAAAQPAGRPLHGGYRLRDAVNAEGIDLLGLVCGSEGTLAIVTEATVRAERDVASREVALFLFDSLEKAAAAAMLLLDHGPDACDLFDRRHLTLARSADVAFDLLIPRAADACLLVEFTADDPRDCRGRLDEAIRTIHSVERLSAEVRRAEDDDDAALFWALARNVVPTMHRTRGGPPAVPFVEDIAIPPPRLVDFLPRLQAAIKLGGVTAMLYAHAAQGELHVRPFVDVSDPVDRARLDRFADALYEQAVLVGGTFGAEQGLGLARTAAFVRHFPGLAQACSRVKALFDPAGILNPGKVVPADGAGASDGVSPGPLESSARGVPRLDVIEPLLSWGDRSLATEAAACNGCGSCRSLSAGTRMCPVFRVAAAEEASPRAKAGLVAAVLSGSVDRRELEGDAARRIADLCFNCHQCRLDCAAGVDIPALVMETKGRHVAAVGLSSHRWMLSRVDRLSAVAGRLPGAANWAIGNPQARWVIEKVLGIAQGRKLPPCTGNEFLRWAGKRGLTRPPRRSGPRVLYFLDTFARWHDPLLAQSFVSVLAHNGIGVFIDPRQVSSGMPMVSEGDLDGARKLARKNVRILAEAVRQGYRIVATEPSAVTCITHDYPLLLDDEETARVAEATSDATTFLWEMHREGRLRLDLEPVPASLLYHAPCHVRMRHVRSPAEHLLGLIPGLTIDATDRGCSGMAGAFGIAREHYRTSLRIGRPLVSAMRDARIAAGVTECSACRLQMEQGTSKPTIHPVKLLARSYGCLEPLGNPLAASGGRLTAS